MKIYGVDLQLESFDARSPIDAEEERARAISYFHNEKIKTAISTATIITSHERMSFIFNPTVEVNDADK